MNTSNGSSIESTASPGRPIRILFLISGRNVPSSRFRVLAWLPRLRQAGLHCTVAASFPEKYDYFRFPGWRISQALKKCVRAFHLLLLALKRYDVVFLERELFDEPGWNWEQSIRRFSRTLVLDIDDAVFLRYPDKFQHIAPMCDAVIAGNSALRDYFSHLNSQVTVIPTCIDTDHYIPVSRPASDVPVIGWIGTPANIRMLQEVLPALQQLRKNHRFVLRLVSLWSGDAPSVDLSGMDVERIDWTKDSELDCIRGFDIGIMPLQQDDEWARYKCGFKLLQYMACGVPPVASPVGVNCEIVEDGASGFLAADMEQWMNALSSLLDDPELRSATGIHARERVVAHYSVDVWSEPLTTLLRDLAMQGRTGSLR